MREETKQYYDSLKTIKEIEEAMFRIDVIDVWTHEDRERYDYLIKLKRKMENERTKNN